MIPSFREWLCFSIYLWILWCEPSASHLEGKSFTTWATVCTFRKWLCSEIFQEVLVCKLKPIRVAKNCMPQTPTRVTKNCIHD
jgi:hypothetical protein